MNSWIGPGMALCLLAAGSFATPAWAASAAQLKCPAMSVAGTAERAGADTYDVTAGDGAVAHVERKGLLAFSDFTTADVTVTEGQVVLNVGLTPEAARRWMAYTAKHVGGRIAFIVDGKAVRTARIKDPNLGKGFLIGPFSQTEARRLAALINGKCAG